MNKNVLFFDTETTGLKLDKYTDTDDRQPMPVQIGMKLDGVNRNERGAFNYCIKTNGDWLVNPRAAEITGIDNDIADEYGCDLITGVEMFLDMMDNAEYIVAHNIAFDVTVMRRATFVYCQRTGQEYTDPFKGKTLACTMVNSTNLVKATPMRYGRYKWPKLEECMWHFFQEKLEGAHDALVDVKGTAKVYYHLMDLGVFSDGTDA